MDLSPNVGSTKFQLSAVGVLIAAAAPFLSNVSPDLALKAVVVIIALYVVANIAQAWINRPKS